MRGLKERGLRSRGEALEKKKRKEEG